MKIVVTGALGHIGSRFIHGILPGDFSEVVLLDNMLTQRYCSLFNLPQGVPFRFFEEDIMTSDLKKHFAGAHAVIHLAAITNAAASFDNQDLVEKVNFEGTERVARACAETGSRLISLSTTSVYGTASEIVDENCPETDLKPQSPYAQSKIRAEKLLESLGASLGLKFISCRFGTIYGTSIGMRFHTAVNKFAWQACMGEPITVWRTALDQKRPYLDVGDAELALKFILKNDLFDNQVYNVLTDNVTVRSIVDILTKYIPSTSIKLVDSKIMNQLSYTVACEKFKAKGFQFRGEIERGIRDTLSLLKDANARPS